MMERVSSYLPTKSTPAGEQVCGLKSALCVPLRGAPSSALVAPFEGGP